MFCPDNVFDAGGDISVFSELYATVHFSVGTFYRMDSFLKIQVHWGVGLAQLAENLTLDLC